MFGFGLLFAGALVGVASVAWPIYLHLRTKRHQRIQTVPSLRLFGFARPQTRRIRLEQLLLLLARVLLLAGLWLLLAQPYWETAIELPLPPVAGERAPEKVLAIVVDDSLAAFHGTGSENRLQHAQAILGAVCRDLPEPQTVVVATTTGQFPSAPMSATEAATYLASLRAVPLAGNAAEALQNLQTELAGKRAALVVAAPRSLALWQELAPETDFRNPVPVWFLDTTSWTAPVYLRGIQRDGDDHVLELAGAPEDLRELPLELRDANGGVTIQRVGVHEALSGRVTLALPPAAGAYVQVRLPPAPNADGGAAHPWASCYVMTGGEAAENRQLVILRANTPAGLLVDQVVTAVCQAFRPDLKIQHLDPAGSASLPQTRLLVVAGGVELKPALQPWLAQQVEQGVRILCFPAGGAAPAGDVLPGWREPAPVPAAELPWQVRNEAGLGLDELLLLGLKDLPAGSLAEPLFPPAAATPVLTSKGGRLLLGSCRLGPRTVLWACGLPLAAEDPAGPVFHPAFALLLERLLFGGGPAAAAPVSAQVGDTVSLTAWFGRETLRGDLVLPDGSVLPVQAGPDEPLLVPVNAAGPYTLKDAAGPVVRVANFPREADPRIFTREQWAAQRPHTPARWVEATFTPSAADFQELKAGAGATRPRQRFDLSPVAVVLLVLFLLVEGAVLLRVWRRQEAVGV